MKIDFENPYIGEVKIALVVLLIAVFVFAFCFGLVDTIMHHKCDSYGEVTGHETKYVYLDSCYIKDIYGNWQKHHQ